MNDDSGSLQEIIRSLKKFYSEKLLLAHCKLENGTSSIPQKIVIIYQFC